MTGVLEVDAAQLAHDILASALTGTRIVGETPANLQDVLPVVQVLRVGGPDDGVILDMPTIAVHAFAATQQAANALCAQAGTAFRDARGQVVNGAVATKVRKLGGPNWAPYTNQAVKHAVSLYQLRVKVA